MPRQPQPLPLPAAGRGFEVKCRAGLRRAPISLRPASGQILNRSGGFTTPLISPRAVRPPEQSRSSSCRYRGREELTQQLRGETQTDFRGGRDHPDLPQTGRCDAATWRQRRGCCTDRVSLTPSASREPQPKREVLLVIKTRQNHTPSVWKGHAAVARHRALGQPVARTKGPACSPAGQTQHLLPQRSCWPQSPSLSVC